MKQIKHYNISSSFWSRLLDIFIEELHSKKERRRKDYLSVAKQVIGVSTLERNIELWYKHVFEGWSHHDLAAEYKGLESDGSSRIMFNKVTNFLIEENAFEGIISERFFLEKLRNSTVLPQLSFKQKEKAFFLKELSATQHPDVYVAKEGALVAVVAVKMHHEKASFDPRIEQLYAEHYGVPCYALIIDVGRSPKLRAGRVGRRVEEESALKVNTVELRSDWAEVEEMLKKDLIDDD